MHDNVVLTPFNS